MARETQFKELSKARIQELRNVVISKNMVSGGYTLAQQILIPEGKKQTALFLKGAIHIDGLEGLYNLRDAVNEAIKASE